MKKILMTGASGYLGRHLLPLLQTHFEVIVVGRQRPLGFQGYFVRCNLLEDSLSSLCLAVKADYLVHLAWNVQGDYWHSPANEAWETATLHLVQAFLDAGGTYVMSIGSCAEYAWDLHKPFHPDFTALTQGNAYAAAKNRTCWQLSHLCQQAKVPFLWARLFFSFGPGEPATKLVSSLVHALMSGCSAYCHQGNQYLDYLYVKDQADALLYLLQQQSQGVINVGSGQGVYLPEFLAVLADCCGAKHLLEVVKDKPVEMRYVVADIAQLLELGWKPSYTLEQGLEEMIEDWIPLQ